MTKNESAVGPVRKRNSGDTKGYADENPGRHGAQAGKDAKTRKRAENVGTGKRKSVR
jgi:hypothetical protein